VAVFARATSILMSEQRKTASQPEQAAKPGDVLCGKYRVERVIGTGGMGVVMEAWHLQFEERVALKFLSTPLAKSDEAVARFEREARVLFKIKSPHVCRVLDVGKTDAGAPFLVLEFLEGDDLANKLVDRKAMAVEDAVDYIVQACDAVGEAHCRGIVHRDIKPENLFLSRAADGSLRIKVLDFGLSKMASSDSTGPRQRVLTNTEQAMGTPHYMSPEQWLSARDVGPASDQWSLAVILFELLAGVPPFDGEQLAHICSQVLHGALPSLTERRPNVAIDLEQALRRALDKDPNARFGNLGQFAAAIARFGRSDSRSISERIARMFEQADALLQSAELSRASFASIALPNPRQSSPGPGASQQIAAVGTENAAPQAIASQPGAAIASYPAGTTAGQPYPGHPGTAGHQHPGQAGHAPAMIATTPNAGQPGSDLPDALPRRAQTAQSWQQLMQQTPPKTGSRAGRALAVLAALAIVGAVGVLVVYPRLQRGAAGGTEAAAQTEAPATSAPTSAPSVATTAANEAATSALATASTTATASQPSPSSTSVATTSSATLASSAPRPSVKPPTPPVSPPPKPPPTKVHTPPPKAPPHSRPNIFETR
jgi:serine/threonine-protein kinase